MTETEKCPLCDATAGATKEHIVPGWLQKYFNLSNDLLGLHNYTKIKYNQEVIAICRNCNNNLLSKLESKIQRGDATEHDYYIWALKIQYFLSLKDTKILLDRSNRLSGPLIGLNKIEISRHFVTSAILNYDNNDYRFDPKPFGSVFIFDNPFTTEFGLIDLPHPADPQGSGTSISSGISDFKSRSNLLSKSVAFSKLSLAFTGCKPAFLVVF
jgi:hypothetical protein